MLKDRIALVTAAGSGIGRAGAIAMAREGAVVVATDLDGDLAQDTCALILAAGERGTSFALDVTDDDACGAAVARVQTYPRAPLFWASGVSLSQGWCGKRAVFDRVRCGRCQAILTPLCIVSLLLEKPYCPRRSAFREPRRIVSRSGSRKTPQSISPPSMTSANPVTKLERSEAR